MSSTSNQLKRKAGPFCPACGAQLYCYYKSPWSPVICRNKECPDWPKSNSMHDCKMYNVHRDGTICESDDDSKSLDPFCVGCYKDQVDSKTKKIQELQGEIHELVKFIDAKCWFCTKQQVPLAPVVNPQNQHVEQACKACCDLHHFVLWTINEEED